MVHDVPSTMMVPSFVCSFVFSGRGKYYGSLSLLVCLLGDDSDGCDGSFVAMCFAVFPGMAYTAWHCP